MIRPHLLALAIVLKTKTLLHYTNNILLIVKSRVKDQSVLKRMLWNLKTGVTLRMMKLECTCIDERALKLQKKRP